MRKCQFSKAFKLCTALIFAITSAILSSCSSDSSEHEQLISENSASIVVTLDSQKIRSAIPLSEITNIVSTYEIIAYNSETHISATFTTISPFKLAVPEGTWNLLILAGKSGYFAGSGWSDNIVLEESETKEIAVDLYPINISISAPETVFYNNEYEVTFSGDTRNPHLAINYIYLSTDSSRGKIEFEETSQCVSCSKIFTAGSTAETSTARFTTSGIYLVCEDFFISEKLENYAALKNIASYTIWQSKNYTFCTTDFTEDTSSSGIRAVLSWKE